MIGFHWLVDWREPIMTCCSDTNKFPSLTSAFSNIPDSRIQFGPMNIFAWLVLFWCIHNLFQGKECGAIQIKSN